MNYMGFFRFLAETEGFEPSMRLYTPYSLSRGAPSATRSRLLKVRQDYRTDSGLFSPTPYLARIKSPVRGAHHPTWLYMPVPRKHRALALHKTVRHFDVDVVAAGGAGSDLLLQLRKLGCARNHAVGTG